MTSNTTLIIALIAYYAVVGPFLKALRDIISFRWGWSAFADGWLPRWLEQYLTDTAPKPWWKSFDGWHQLDGALQMFPLALILWVLSLPLWKVVLAWLILGVVFYAVFNLLYHFILTGKKHRGY